MTIDYIIVKMKEIMKSSNINQIQLAEKANIPLQTVREIFRGKTKNPRIETIQSLIRGLEILSNSNLNYLLNNYQNTEEYKYITKNKANIFDNDGKLTELELSPNNVNKIIAMIKALEEEERKIKYKKNVTPIIIKPQGVPEEELIPAVARSKDNAVKAVYLTKEQIEDILSQGE